MFGLERQQVKADLKWYEKAFIAGCQTLSIHFYKTFHPQNEESFGIKFVLAHFFISSKKETWKVLEYKYK